jgi:endonuclease G
MLRQIAPEDTLESLPRPQAAASALESTADHEETADIALRKLEEGRHHEITPPEMFVLEAIVMPQNRPVVFIRDGVYEDVGAPWEHLNGAEVRSRITPLLASIGRVELPNASWVPYGGTGFVVGPNLLMTNRHVARLFTEGVGDRGLIYRSGDAALDFKREVDTPADDREAYVIVRSVKMVHPYWDMALLEVENLPAGHPPLKLSVHAPEDLAGRDVVVVGYPARDNRNDLDLQDRIFARKYNVKRLQPGQLRPRANVLSFEQTVNALTHDSSTLGGNSGSAILDLQSGEIVGLHFAGEYLKANYAVPAYELGRDSRVVDAGVNFAGSLAATSDWASAWQRVSGAEATTGAVQPRTPTPTTVTTAAPAAGGSPGSFTFTVPLQVTVTIGQAVSAAAAPEVEALQPPVIFDGLEHREGYQTDFLDLDGGKTVPLPELTSVGKSVAAKLEDGSTELKYHKFSLVIHKGRRLALFTAANVDWREAARQVDGKKPTRQQLTGLSEGNIEQWVTDWRIPAEHQLPDLFFTKDDGAFDKGHLVRRDDVAWGTSFEDMQMSNGDTYHTTNCSPQTSAFNQSARGTDNWGDLENLVQKETNAETAIIFSGPVLALDDPLFNGRDKTGRVLVRIPRRFWKIILVKGEAGPQAFGFVLEQDLSKVPLREEFAVPAAWKRYMRSIAEIEHLLNGLAKLTFLKKYDQLDTQEGRRVAEGVMAG